MQIGYTVNVNLFRGALMVKIITDSASDFEPNELKELMIDCIPLSVNFGDEEYKDNVTISKDEFFDKLKNTTETVKTSQPSLHDIAEEFEAAEHSKDGGVAIFMSSKISGTANTAQIACDMIGCKNVYVIDSLTASAGQKLLVEYAVKLRRQGKNSKEIYEEIERIKTKISLLACLDTLEYLHNGGRVSQTKAMFATVARIKPVIRLSGGNVELLAKSFNIKRGIKSLAERLEREELNPYFPVYVMYSDNESLANDLTSDIKRLLPNVHSVETVKVGAVIGSHIGTNACGIAFVKL